MRSFLIAAVALCFGQAVQAADLPFLRGSFQDEPVAPRRMWDGFYVGGQAGYSSTATSLPAGINADIQPSYPAGTYRWPALDQRPQASNAGYGGFFGYNSQWEDVVVGLEGNYIHGRYDTTSTRVGQSVANDGTTLLETNSSARVRVDDFGSLRLRAGYIAGNFLPYAFVGGGVGNLSIERNTVVIPGPASSALTTSANSSKLAYGYSAGLGIDVMLVAGLFMRAEYEYQRITSKDIDINVNSARVGVGYKF